VREVSKLFEEAVRGRLGELAQRWKESPPKGEVTLIVAGAPEKEKGGAANVQGLTVEMLIAAGLEPRQAAKVIARLQGRSSREVYQEAVRARCGSEEKE
jgi:16S rRNA (cytidine1402-2'-O)-methyltransferase